MTEFQKSVEIAQQLLNARSYLALYGAIHNTLLREAADASMFSSNTDHADSLNLARQQYDKVTLQNAKEFPSQVAARLVVNTCSKIANETVDLPMAWELEDT
jgi:hypothetical protein